MTADTSEPAKISKPAPVSGLYIVATPIGNLRDITFRAVDTLATVDLIACEDTRVTAKLLAAHNIRTATTAYHEHNAAKVRPNLMRRLMDGESVALVSDAGTPLISDPGYRLVLEASAAGITVTPIPGASATLAALSVSGLPTDRFLFVGFLPSRSGQRRKALQELSTIDSTLVFFESAKRLGRSLVDMSAALGARDAVIARELTKRFEEIRRDSLQALAEHYAGAQAPRGEIVVVVGPPGPSEHISGADVDKMLRDALVEMSVRDAAAHVSAETGNPRRDLYNRALALTARRAKT